MTSNIQPSNPMDENAPIFESTLIIEDQDFLINDLKNSQQDSPQNLFEMTDKESSDINAFIIEANNSGGFDQDSKIFLGEEGADNSDFTINNTYNMETNLPQSPILIEVPSNADFFNMKSSQEYIIEEDQHQTITMEIFNLHEEERDQILHDEGKQSDTPPFTDASEKSFMAGASNVDDHSDMAPPTRLRFSAERCYSSSSTTDPQCSMSAPSISIMEGDDNPNSLTSPLEVSSISSSNSSSNDSRSPPSKSVKTENKTSASQKIYNNSGSDDLSGYTSDISSEEGMDQTAAAKVPYFELRITLAQYNFFRIVRLPQNINLNDMYVVAMEALDWDDDKYKEQPHHFIDEAGRIFASKIRAVSNIPPEEEGNVKDELSYSLNQVLKHEKSVLTLHYFSRKDWVISIAVQEIFVEKPNKDSHTQEVYCTSGRGGSISEEDTSKNGKFNKSQVNRRLQEVKFKSTQ